MNSLQSGRPAEEEEEEEEKLRRFISTCPPATLRAWTLQAAADLPAFKSWLLERRAEEEGDSEALLERARVQVEAVIPGIRHCDGWGRNAVIEDADWEALNKALRASLAAGLHDDILALVPRMLDLGGQRLEADLHRDDIGTPISDSILVALGGLAECALSRPERILHVYKLKLRDDYSLLPDLDPLWQGYQEADWSVAAEGMKTLLATRREPGKAAPQNTSEKQLLAEMLRRAGRENPPPMNL